MLSPVPVHAIFGITNDALNLAVSLILLFLVVIWLALVYWTFADARRRIADPLLVGCATLAALFPFVGTIVYMIVRPPEYLDDVRERDLEILAAEARLAEAGYEQCPHCGESVEKDFLRCPSCMRKLKDPCPRCARPLRPGWQICPFCELELAEPVGARRRRSAPPPDAASARAGRGRRASAPPQEEALPPRRSQGSRSARPGAQGRGRPDGSEPASPRTTRPPSL